MAVGLPTAVLDIVSCYALLVLVLKSGFSIMAVAGMQEVQQLTNWR